MVADKYKASVTFYLESEPTTPYAKRQWDYIPRVGECVLLGAGGKYPADRNGLAMFMIKQICWGVNLLNKNHMASSL